MLEHIWMVSAENGALPGGKVGGVGDVLRDLPLALAGRGLNVRVITPSYGVFHKLPHAELHRRVRVEFGGATHDVDIHRLDPALQGDEIYVIEHPLITGDHPGRIYHHDAPGRPFATDAGRFAFFSASVAAWANQAEEAPTLLHLHDWQTAMIPWLRERAAKGDPIRATRIVYTIHNIAYQSIRPIRGDESSMETWFPDYEDHIELARDPNYPDCVNFMATAIRLADMVNTVSATYAREILRPSDPAHGFIGGEGLEGVLRDADEAGRLTGILNGCPYLDAPVPVPNWNGLIAAIREDRGLMEANPQLEDRLALVEDRRPKHVLLSISRIAPQKISLFLQPVANYDTALEAILDCIHEDAVFIFQGTGEKALEQRLADIAATRRNLLFLRAYAESISELLYQNGDLFLMPSSFEPCGISQMLAMREGQPCVVHAVGGLAETVDDGINGFSFGGETFEEQAANLVRTVLEALSLRETEPELWEGIRGQAAACRFSWDRSVTAYIEQMYESKGHDVLEEVHEDEAPPRSYYSSELAEVAEAGELPDIAELGSQSLLDAGAADLAPDPVAQSK